MIIWVNLALAAPPWVLDFTSNGAGPPADTCTTTAKVAPTAPAPASAAKVGPHDATSSMVQYDLAPDATNAALPEELRRTLQVGSPFDLAAVPLEPLRGAAADIERVKSVFTRAVSGRERVHIAAWGASHIAGEYWTGEIRRQLQTLGGDLGHGFVMPAAPWRGYRAGDVNLCTRGAWTGEYDGHEGTGAGRLGPMGIGVSASVPDSMGWVQTTRSNAQGRAVSTFEVLYAHQPAGGTLNVVVDAEPPIRVVTAGPDGPGLAVIHVADGPHRLTVAPVGDGPVRLYGANLERAGAGVVLDAAGVVGRTASSWLRWDEPTQRAYLDRRTPDLVILAYGTNEANDPAMTPDAYRGVLRRVLARMRAVLPQAACVLVGPSDRGKLLSGSTYVIWGRTTSIADAQREVGPEFHCATWDMQAATGGPGSVFRWRTYDPTLMAADLLHYSAAGYQELARRFLAISR